VWEGARFDTSMTVPHAARPRPTVTLSKSFTDMIAATLEQHPTVLFALKGVYEGRELEGEYTLVIEGAKLVPK
jgi:hypothetical protein